MPKAGSNYQELVAEIVRALDANAQVETGKWVSGPDGAREVDVEVRSTQTGEPWEEDTMVIVKPNPGKGMFCPIAYI